MNFFIKLKKTIVKKYVYSNFDQIEYRKKTTNISNKNKIKYYIIASSKKRGFFSLVLFVLNHIKFAKKNFLVPVIDMENYKTIYNEDKIFLNTKNAWEYYFDKKNRLDLDKIYKEKNYIISNDENLYTKNNKFHNSLKTTYKKEIKIKVNIKKKILFYRKKFRLTKDNKILGIHFRGTDMKISPNHPMPPSKSQILEKIRYCQKKFNVTKIFLVTEDLNNFIFMKKKFGDNVFTIDNFRSNKTKVFHLKIRKNHRYKMGEEALINGFLLSYCRVVVSSQTGISDFAKFINKKLLLIKINNGLNSSKVFFSFFKWKFKYFLK